LVTKLSVRLSEEDIRKLSELQKYLVTRLKDLKRKVELIESFLLVIDKVLAQASFVRGSEVQEMARTEAKPTPPAIRRVPIKHVDGTTLAELLIDKNKIVVLMAPGVNLHKATRPFESFFIRDVLEAMRERDYEKYSRGEIQPGQILDYRIQSDENGVLQKIEILNVSDEKRVREIKSAIKWTLRRMYENEYLTGSQSK